MIEQPLCYLLVPKNLMCYYYLTLSLLKTHDHESNIFEFALPPFFYMIQFKKSS